MSSASIQPESGDSKAQKLEELEGGRVVTPRDPQWELIQVCVSVGQLLGLPRSVGEIFGFIFTSAAPVTFEQIAAGLGMSNGSASHGLRYLRRMGAIEVSYHARDRRDFFQPQTALKTVVSGFMTESVLFHLRGVGERLRTLSELNGNSENPRNNVLLDRIGILQSWNEQARVALTAALETLR